MLNRLNPASWFHARLAACVALVLAGCAAVIAADAARDGAPSGLTPLAEYTLNALEVEVAGIHPHPMRDGVFLVAANSRPAYAAGQTPVLPSRYRGKLLEVDGRTGEITRALTLVDGDYGGLAFARGALYVARLDPPEIVELELAEGRVLRRIPIPGPAGGLEYDADRGVLLAQLYNGFPHIAVIDVRSGKLVDTLTSDESAMDLAKVQGDLLCTWVSSFDAHAFSELRRIDAATGAVTGRVRLPDVHTSMAALDPAVAGVHGFIALVRAADGSGRVSVRKYGYDRARVRW